MTIRKSLTCFLVFLFSLPLWAGHEPPYIYSVAVTEASGTTTASTNGYAEAGETMSLSIEVQNGSGVNTADLTVTISTLDPFAEIVSGADSFVLTNMTPGEIRFTGLDNLQIKVRQDAPCGHRLAIRFHVISSICCINENWHTEGIMVGEPDPSVIASIGPISLEDLDFGGAHTAWKKDSPQKLAAVTGTGGNVEFHLHRLDGSKEMTKFFSNASFPKVARGNGSWGVAYIRSGSVYFREVFDSGSLGSETAIYTGGNVPDEAVWIAADPVVGYAIGYAQGSGPYAVYVRQKGANNGSLDPTMNISVSLASRLDGLELANALSGGGSPDRYSYFAFYFNDSSTWPGVLRARRLWLREPASTIANGNSTTYVVDSNIQLNVAALKVDVSAEGDGRYHHLVYSEWTGFSGDNISYKRFRPDTGTAGTELSLLSGLGADGLTTRIGISEKTSSTTASIVYIETINGSSATIRHVDISGGDSPVAGPVTDLTGTMNYDKLGIPQHLWTSPGRLTTFLVGEVNDQDALNYLVSQAADNHTFVTPLIDNEPQITEFGQGGWSAMAATGDRIGAFTFSFAEAGWYLRIRDFDGQIPAGLDAGANPKIEVEYLGALGGAVPPPTIEVASDGSNFLVLWALGGTQYAYRIYDGYTGLPLTAELTLNHGGGSSPGIDPVVEWMGDRYRYVFSEQDFGNSQNLYYTGTITAAGVHETGNNATLKSVAFPVYPDVDVAPSMACTGDNTCYIGVENTLFTVTLGSTLSRNLNADIHLIGSDGNNGLVFKTNGSFERVRADNTPRSTTPVLDEFTGEALDYSNLVFTGGSYALVSLAGELPTATFVDLWGDPLPGYQPNGSFPMVSQLDIYSQPDEFLHTVDAIWTPAGDLGLVFSRDNSGFSDYDVIYTRVSLPDNYLTTCALVANEDPTISAGGPYTLIIRNGGSPYILTDGNQPANQATFVGSASDPDFGGTVVSGGWDFNEDGIIDRIVTDANSDGAIDAGESTVVLTSNELLSFGFPTNTISCGCSVRFYATDQLGATTFASSVVNLVDEVVPVIELTTPNGGEAWPAESEQNITWSASDNVGLTNFDLTHVTEQTFLPNSSFPVTLIEDDWTYFYFDIPTPFTVLDANLTVDVQWAGVEAGAAIFIQNIDTGGAAQLQWVSVPQANFTDLIGNYDRTLNTDTTMAVFDNAASGSQWVVGVYDFSGAGGGIGVVHNLKLNLVDSRTVITTVNDPAARSYTWTLPTETSANSRIEITANDSSGNSTQDDSDRNFFITQANSDQVRTLVVWNEQRMLADYPSGTVAQLKDKLLDLAGHVKIDGVLLDLSSGEAVTAGVDYTNFDGTSWNDNVTTDNDALVAEANILSNAIRTFLYDQVESNFPNLEYLVFVGGDDYVPFFRIQDTTIRHPETEYITELQSFGFLDDYSVDFCMETRHPMWATICANHYPSDGAYGAPETDMVPGSGLTWYIPDVAVGRMIESPAQIMGLVDTYVLKDGVTIAQDILVSGYDFLTDGGEDAYSRLDAALDTTDPDAGGPLEAPTRLELLSQNNGLWSDTDLKDRLFGQNSQEQAEFSLIFGHADHRAEGAAAVGAAGILTSDELNAGTGLVPGGLLIGVGCHTGFNIQAGGGPADETDSGFLLDLPEAFSSKQFPVFVGNSGFGWGLSEGVGLGERLITLTVDEINNAGQISMGEALRLAKGEYFLRQDRLDTYDHKVIHEATLYGIPNYEIRVTKEPPAPLTGPVVKSASGKTLSRQLKELDLGDSDWSEVTINGRTLKKSEPVTIPIPGGEILDTINVDPASLRVMEFNYQAYQKGQDTDGDINTEDWEEAFQRFDLCKDSLEETVICTGANGDAGVGETKTGIYFTLDGVATGEGGQAIQPMISFDSRLVGTELHGILMTGGEYVQPSKINPLDPATCTDEFGTIHPCFNPVIGNPETKVDYEEGPAPAPFMSFASASPFMSFASASPNGFTEGPLTSNSSSERFDTLNAPMGEIVRQAVADNLGVRSEIYAERLYRTREFTQYYSNSTDWTPPAIGAYTADCYAEIGGDDCYSTLNGLQMDFVVPVTEDQTPPGVFKVYVVYQDGIDSQNEGAWQQLELTPDGAGNWTGSLSILRTTHYLIHAVDWSGNIGTVLVTGDDLDEGGSSIGSSYNLPRLYTVDITDTDGDGLPDWIENNTNGLDPNLEDSDGDGINDDLDDLDHDGLTTLQELELGLDPADPDSDDDGDNDGSEYNNLKNPYILGDGDNLQVGMSVITNDVTLAWPRGSLDGSAYGTDCGTPDGGPCFAVAQNNSVDGHFRVFVSDTGDFSGNIHSVGPDDDMDDGAQDLDQIDQRVFTVTDASLSGALQAATILFYRVENIDLVAAGIQPTIEFVMRSSFRFTIFGTDFNPDSAQPLLCESASTCNTPVLMTIVAPESSNRSETRIQADAPGATTGTWYIAVENPGGKLEIYPTPYAF